MPVLLVRHRLTGGLLAAVLLLSACSTTARNGDSSTPSTAIAATGAIGYIGCSNTWMAVAGYHQAHGDGRLWPALQAYGGGSIDRWASGQYWPTFERTLAEQPVVAVWWHLCMHPGTTQTQVDAVLAHLRRDIGASTPIYVTAMATYAASGECGMADPAGSKVFFDALVSQGRALAGPTLTPLAPSNTASDGCHPGGAARVADGDALAACFH